MCTGWKRDGRKKIRKEREMGGKKMSCFLSVKKSKPNVAGCKDPHEQTQNEFPRAGL